MTWQSVLLDKPSLYMQYVHTTNALVQAFLELGDTHAGGTQEYRDNADQMNITAMQQYLRGIPIAVKDNIAVQPFKLTCGSHLLEQFSSPYTATAVAHMQRAGAQVIGKTNLDEFAMGSTTHNSYFQITHNPWNIQYVPGGSSGGSAAAVASGMVPLALGSDTGGSVRQPASFCGVYALKPSYGSISRYGLVSYASSLDVIGILAESVDLLEAAYSCMSGRDERDMTSYTPSERRLPRQKAHIGVCHNFITDSEESVHRGYDEAIERLRNQGHEIVPLELPDSSLGLSAYYIISTAEASANLARYDGIRYGTRSVSDNFSRLVPTTRAAGLGSETQLRILMGTYVLRSRFYDQYYAKAQKVRTQLQRVYAKIFQSVDALLLPTAPTQAYIVEDLDPFYHRIGDRFTVLANLLGCPALAFPVSAHGGMPLGMQIMGPRDSEQYLCSIARSIGEPLQRPPDMPGALKWIAQGQQ